MLPTLVDRQLTQGLKSHLESQFPMATPHFAGLWDAFFRGSEQVVKGPYLQLELPFRKAHPSAGRRFAPAIKDIGFTPYLHQQRAFDRLCGVSPRATLVATGTGSGKTECFLLPILEHCAAHRSERGIRAIIVYPMNALATDQAGRIAKLIHEHLGLKGIRVGLYIGEDKGESWKSSQGGGKGDCKSQDGKSGKRDQEMGADHVITDRAALREHPPHILLTNYKMLDYLLIRPEDAELWRDNADGELRYCVVDELHSYDGAQAADLACLLRRVKARMRLEPGHLCCIGTSATLGGGEASEEILGYAGAVFGETFDPTALIGEDRLTAPEFLPASGEKRETLAAAEDYLPTVQDNEEEYLRRQLGLWGFAVGGADLVLFRALRDGKTPADQQNVDRLARRLLAAPFAAALIRRCAGHVPLLSAVSAAMARNLFDDEEPARVGQVEAAIRSLTALLSRIRQVCGRAYDYPDVRIQYWAREMSRMVVSIRPDSATLAFADDLTDSANLAQACSAETGGDLLHLPLANCRTCGCSGWIGVYAAKDKKLLSNLDEIYRHYFSKGSDQIRFIVPLEPGETPRHLHGEIRRFCSACRSLAAGPGDTVCPECGSKALLRVAVQRPKMEKHTRQDGQPYAVGRRICPTCGADDGGILLLGMRTATLCSHLIATLNGSVFNLDKKIIAFSDNVQDASHRASFFGARTWSATFRAQLAHTIHENALADTPLPDFLTTLLDDLRRRHPDARTKLAAFIPQDCKWWRDWHELEERDAFPSAQTLNWLELRLRWETCMEFGFKSNIGRTLEKTGVAAAYVKLPEMADGCWQTVLTTLRNEIAALRALTLPKLRACVVALTDLMLRRGAVLDAEVVPFILREADLSVLRWREPLKWALLALSRGGIHPVFPGRSTTGGTPRLALALTPGAELNDLFQSQTGCDDPVALEAFLNALVDAGILKKVVSGPKARAAMEYWLLPQERVVVSGNLASLRCPVCGRGRQAPRALLEAEDGGLPCRGPGCPGIAVPATIPPHHYRQQYVDGAILRLVAAEHTGLLKRSEREKIERRFKSPNPEAWYPNLLSATPTLEMGIDIGDLSTVLLCSVPPNQSSYVQRIGRSGRKTGGAVNVTVANARPHDLYFFLAPEEMMAGGVRAPGVCLDAVSVLQRQYLGFAIGEWVANAKGGAVFPRDIRGMLKALDDRASTFPTIFLDWHAARRDDLAGRFVDSLGVHVSTATAEALRRHATGADGGGLEKTLQDEVASLRGVLQGYESKAQAITAQLKAVKADVSLTQEARDKQCEELEKERGAFRTLLRKLRSETVWGWLCDMASLLPNYAFPEEGVGLQTILYRENKGASGEESSSKVEYEIKRPASTALRELAPGMEFYAYGHHVPIGAVDMAQTEAPARWRFCPECDAMMPDGAGVPPLCPQCQADWSDIGQVRTLLRPRQFITVGSERNALTVDSSDQRQPGWFDCKLFFERRSIATASFHSPPESDTPFGFEYIAHLVMREVNFGKPDINVETSASVNGEPVRGAGFDLCPVCGRAKLEEDTGHAPWCDAPKRGDQPAPFVNHQLYREYNTEALRLFIPVLLTGDEQVESLMAAIVLGLERQFHGRVDHIKITLQTLPIPGSALRQHFLVLYDAVPGGTGYLRQFVEGDGALIFDVFDKARTVLQTCACGNDAEKDGCYHCLFRYQNQSRRGKISRRSALKILDQLLDLRSRMVFERQDLSVVDYLAGLLESELERAFVRQLDACVKALKGSCEATVVRGLTQGLMLRIPGANSGQECVWACVFQEAFGREKGVLRACRPDAVLYPQETGSTTARPVAVFLDGWEYHKEIVADDLRKRIALMDAGYRVWSLAWSDVDPHSTPETPEWMRKLAAPTGTASGLRKGLFDHYRKAVNLHNPDHPKEDPTFFWNEWLNMERGLDRLMTYLRVGDDSLFAAHAQCDAHCLGKYVASASAERLVIPGAQAAFLPEVPADAPLSLLRAGRNAVSVQVWKDEQAAARVAIRLICRYDDTPPNDDLAEWKAFFAYVNVFQFLAPGAALFYSKSLLDDPFWAERNRAQRRDEQGAWELLLENFAETDDPCRAVIAALQATGVAEVPAAFEDIERASDGEVVGFGQLVWSRAKCAWLDGPASGSRALREEGWLVGVAREDSPGDFAKHVFERTKE